MELGSPGHMLFLFILWLAWLGLRGLVRTIKNEITAFFK